MVYIAFGLSLLSGVIARRYGSIRERQSHQLIQETRDSYSCSD